MSSLAEQLEDIVEYMSDSLSSVNKVRTGFTPVGTIIAVMGNTAPANYLACNGQTVNIANYPELANYFEEQFGTKNHFGGDGTTTFGIPDLRGEFLRGAGTNSHENQGNGSAVGTHQDATEIPRIWTNADSSHPRLLGVGNAVAGQGSEHNVDSWSPYKATTGFQTNLNSVSTWADTSPTRYALRPTNTSVLYCIATKNIYINDGTPSGGDYSTEERYVCNWIDGSRVYQKTINVGDLSESKDVAHGISNMDKVISAEGMAIFASQNNSIPLPYYTGFNQIGIGFSVSDSIIRITTTYGYPNYVGYITLRYTKSS